MEFGSREVNQLVENIWSTLLNRAVKLAPDNDPMGTEEYLTGCIQITGSWSGVVVLYCRRELVREAAEVMFGLPPDEVSFELMQDCLGELTNILGGNIKALFGGMCSLGLPTVTTGQDYAHRVMDSREVLCVAYTSGGWPFVVRIRERIAPRSPRVHGAATASV